jgi:hypothetical protein
MKVFTRPFITILASPAGAQARIGTGTFVNLDGVKVLTCEHVSRLNPSARFIDDTGSTTEVQVGAWRAEADVRIDAAVAPIDEQAWSRIAGKAQSIPLSKFAQRHTDVQNEVLFFRGISGENAHYLSGFGDDVTFTGYCSQEKKNTGDANEFEILWGRSRAEVTSGTEDQTRKRFKYEDPAGFSGSLVWNSRFVQFGCDLSKWHPVQGDYNWVAAAL